jgi:hypothetical protein
MGGDLKILGGTGGIGARRARTTQSNQQLWLSRYLGRLGNYDHVLHLSP